MAAILLAPELQLPWESTREEDRRFQQVLGTLLLGFALIAIVVPFLPVAELAVETVVEAPPQLAHIILQPQDLPEPEPVKPVPKPKLQKPAPPKPLAKVKEKPQETSPVKPRPVDELAQARTLAAQSGLLAFKDDLTAMRDSVDINSLNQENLSRGQASAATTERSVITSGVRADSGGIKTSQRSRDTGGTALSGRETTRVQSTIASKVAQPGASASASVGGRSDESIRRIMDRNKSAIFAIYNRALRVDPLLEGKVVFEMVIDASGRISQISLVSSEIADTMLTSKILSRIRLIDFGSKDVVSTHVNYSFDFLPFT